MSEVWLDDGALAGQLDCPPALIPAPGQYLVARPAEEPHLPLPEALFASGYTPGGFRAAPPLPPAWQPGVELLLRGPLGRGFDLPAGLRRLAVAVLGGSPARLLPLVDRALQAGASVALFGPPRQTLPAAVEVLPLDSLPEALAWADFLALQVSLEGIPRLPNALGLPADGRVSCAAQVLVLSGVPCAGLADCGACAVRTRRGWKLACKDGPVFEWDTLAFT